MKTMALLQCNNNNCEKKWEREINTKQINKHRLTNLVRCPHCQEFRCPKILATEL